MGHKTSSFKIFDQLRFKFQVVVAVVELQLWEERIIINLFKEIRASGRLHPGERKRLKRMDMEKFWKLDEFA